jgi:hypothetical protein
MYLSLCLYINFAVFGGHGSDPLTIFVTDLGHFLPCITSSDFSCFANFCREHYGCELVTMISNNPQLFRLLSRFLDDRALHVVLSHFYLT